MTSYAFWSPINVPAGAFTVSGGGLITTLVNAIASRNNDCLGLTLTSGVYRFAVELNTSGTGAVYCIADSATSLNITSGNPTNCLAMATTNGLMFTVNGGSTTVIASIGIMNSGDVLSVVFDTGTGPGSSGTAQAWMRVNGGNWNGNPAADPNTFTGGLAIPAGVTAFTPLLSQYLLSPETTLYNGSVSYPFTMPTSAVDLPPTLQIVSIGSSYGALTSIPWVGTNVAGINYSLDGGSQVACTGGTSGSSGTALGPLISDFYPHTLQLFNTGFTYDVTLPSFYFSASGAQQSGGVYDGDPLPVVGSAVANGDPVAGANRSAAGPASLSGSYSGCYFALAGATVFGELSGGPSATTGEMDLYATPYLSSTPWRVVQLYLSAPTSSGGPYPSGFGTIGLAAGLTVTSGSTTFALAGPNWGSALPGELSSGSITGSITNVGWQGTPGASSVTGTVTVVDSGGGTLVASGVLVPYGGAIPNPTDLTTVDSWSFIAGDLFSSDMLFSIVVSGVPITESLTLTSIAGTFGGTLSVGGEAIGTLPSSVDISVDNETTWSAPALYTHTGASSPWTVAVSAAGVLTAGTYRVNIRDHNDPAVVSNQETLVVTEPEILTLTTISGTLGGSLSVGGEAIDGLPSTVDISLDNGSTWGAPGSYTHTGSASPWDITVSASGTLAPGTYEAGIRDDANHAIVSNFLTLTITETLTLTSIAGSYGGYLSVGGEALGSLPSEVDITVDDGTTWLPPATYTTTGSTSPWDLAVVAPGVLSVGTYTVAIRDHFNIGEVSNYLTLVIGTGPTTQLGLYSGGVIPTPEDTYLEFGTPLEFIYETVLLPDNQQLANNSMPRTALAMQFIGQEPGIIATCYDNAGNTLGSVTITPAGADTFWDTAEWDVAPWDGAAQAFAPNWLPWSEPIVFKQAQFRATGTSTAGFKIGNLYAEYKVLGYMQQQLSGVT
jgi:hypothetical protein